MISFFVGHMAFRSIRFEPVCGCAMARFLQYNFSSMESLSYRVSFSPKSVLGRGGGDGISALP